jgi:hypothetical protein
LGRNNHYQIIGDMKRTLLSIVVQFVSTIAVFCLSMLLLPLIMHTGWNLAPVFLLSIPFSMLLGIMLKYIFRTREFIVGLIAQLILSLYVVSVLSDGTFAGFLTIRIFESQFWSSIAQWYALSISCLSFPIAIGFSAVHLFKKYIVNQRPNGA